MDAVEVMGGAEGDEIGRVVSSSLRPEHHVVRVHRGAAAARAVHVAPRPSPWVERAGRRRGEADAQRVGGHLGCELDAIVLVAERFPVWEHVNLQRGVDAYLARRWPKFPIW